MVKKVTILPYGESLSERLKKMAALISSGKIPVLAGAWITDIVEDHQRRVVFTGSLKHTRLYADNGNFTHFCGACESTVTYGGPLLELTIKVGEHKLLLCPDC